MTAPRKPAPLTMKPDLEDAARRWEAFYAGDIIDRPIVLVRAPVPGRPKVPPLTYRERMFDGIDRVIDRAIECAESIWHGGEAVPGFYPSIGTDEVAAFCGAEIRWSEDSGDTNWSVPFVEDWDETPLKIDPNGALWKRTLEMYRRAGDRLAGKMLVHMPDLHTNMDLLMSARGSERLCMDLIDRPEAVDRAMGPARAVFRELWSALSQAAKMDERGYANWLYSMNGAATLQCDFSCMISPAMFRRWALPALVEEAGIARNAIYHWDGPEALKHLDDLATIPRLHALSYVSGAGRGDSFDFLSLAKRVQAKGKAAQLWANPEQIMNLYHPNLRPEKVVYDVWVKTPEEGERLLEWLVKHT